MHDHVASLPPVDKVRRREIFDERKRERGHVVFVRPGRLSFMADTTIIMKGPQEPNPNPTWLGDNLNGELGALAVNDNHASTVYEYERQHWPGTPSIPKPTTGVGFPGSNGVNPNASDEYLAYTWDADARAAINNADYRVIFFIKGIDGDQNGFNVTVGGTESVPRYFVYADLSDPDAVDDIKPWNMDTADRAIVGEMRQVGAPNLFFIGLDFTPNKFGRTEGSDNVTFYRCMSQNYPSHACGPQTTRSDNFHLLECYSGPNGPSSSDIHFFIQQVRGVGTRVISCEGRDLSGDFAQWSQTADADDNIIEDCDYYRTLFTNNDGVETNDDSLLYCRGEGFVDIKDDSPSLTSEWSVQVLGNRCWFMRAQDFVIKGDNGADGYPFIFSRTSTFSQFVNIQYNVFEDIACDNISMHNGQELGGGNHNIQYNLLCDTKENGNQALRPVGNNISTLNNTVADTTCNRLCNFQRTGPTPVPGCDMRNNLFLDGPASQWANTDELDNDAVVNNNGYGGTGDTVSIGSGTNQTESTRANLNLGDFTYKRKKLTTPENGKITGVVPTSTTPVGFRTGAN